RVGRVLHSLGINRSLREPGEIFAAVLEEGEEVTLTANLTLKRGSIHGEPAIELSGADPYKFAELRELGLINEQIKWKQRFFIPSDEERGVAILADLLARYPVLTDEAESEEPEPTQPLPETTTYGSTLKIVDIQSWVIDVPGYRPEPTREPPADEPPK